MPRNKKHPDQARDFCKLKIDMNDCELEGEARLKEWRRRYQREWRRQRRRDPVHGDAFRALERERMKKRYHEKPGVKERMIQNTRRSRLRRFYGIEPEEYDRLSQDQKGLCAICQKPESRRGKTLSVDHDHETGAVRGLLCHSCNLGLGKFQDDWILVERAHRYLVKHDRRRLRVAS